jgi:hypothetical protein
VPGLALAGGVMPGGLKAAPAKGGGSRWNPVLLEEVSLSECGGLGLLLGETSCWGLWTRLLMLGKNWWRWPAEAEEVLLDAGACEEG